LERAGDGVEGEPAQWPKIQQEQNERERDHHRFGHQAQSEENESQDVKNFGFWVLDFEFFGIANISP
jgi:hypothetical protein